MILRRYRLGDSAGVEDLWQRNPSIEFPLMGLNPGEVRNLLQRTERWNIRIILGLARALHRPIFTFLVLEDEGKLVGTTMIAFGPNMGTIGGVTVDAAYRRKGHAQELLRTCERMARQYRRRYLVLNVLSQNEAAIRLYEKLGYRTIRSIRWMSRDLSQPSRAVASSQRWTIRAFRPAMARQLAHLANEDIPASERPMISVRPRDLQPSGLARRIGGADSSAWVLQRDQEVVGFVRATVSPVLQAAEVGPLVLVGRPDTDAWTDLIDTALNWCLARRAPRAILSLPEHLEKALPVVQSEGFAESLRLHTMALDLESKTAR